MIFFPYRRNAAKVEHESCFWVRWYIDGGADIADANFSSSQQSHVVLNNKIKHDAIKENRHPPHREVRDKLFNGNQDWVSKQGVWICDEGYTEVVVIFGDETLSSRAFDLDIQKRSVF